MLRVKVFAKYSAETTLFLPQTTLAPHKEPPMENFEAAAAVSRHREMEFLLMAAKTMADLVTFAACRLAIGSRTPELLREREREKRLCDKLSFAWGRGRR